MPLAPLDRRRGNPASDRRLGHVVDVSDTDSVPGRPLAVRTNLEVALAANRVGNYVDGAGDIAQHGRNLFGSPNDIFLTTSQHTHPDLGVDSCIEHVDTILDRHCPDVRPTRHRQGPVQLACVTARHLVTIARPQKQVGRKAAAQIGVEFVEYRMRIDDRQGRMWPRAMMAPCAGRLRFRALRIQNNSNLPGAEHLLGNFRQPGIGYPAAFQNLFADRAGERRPRPIQEFSIESLDMIRP